MIAEQFRGQEERFTVVEADLHEAEALVARGGAEGYEVVVSRGGTAELLERLLDIPVVHIQVSLTDILRAVRTAGTMTAGQKIGVAGFPNMIYGCAELSELLPLEVVEIEVHGARDAEEKLRVLQEREVMPLGGESIVPIDVRVIAATNQNLARMVEAGTFRSDLYYRLNILRIHMPALAERRADIPLLVRSLMRRLAHLNGEITGISDEAVELLRIRPWPGNIRQLQNMMERLMLLADGTEITAADVRRAEEDDREELSGTQPHTEEEGDVLQRILAEEHYNLSRAAKRLGIHRTTLWRRMKNMK